jgi:hypothetical protein
MKINMLMEELEGNGKPEYKIFCDMDGVVADFVKGMYKLIQNYDDTKYLQDPKYRNIMWQAVSDYSKKGGKLWGDLDMMPDGMVLWNYISKYPNTEILTASGDPKYGAPEQKVEWVKRRFGDVKTNVVRKSEEKAAFAKPNHILIDDMHKSIDPWVAAGGIGILHRSAADTINKLKELGL